MRRQATPAARALGMTHESMPAAANASGQFTPTPLFGFGLVEAISEEEILSRVDSTDDDGDGISGRPGRTERGALGRFGRKAETATLIEFTDLALRLEMGLTTPLTPVESGYQGGALPPGTDDVPEPEVGPAVFAELVQFVRFLAPPARATYGASHRDSVARGERLFESLGCAKCHVPAMSTGPNPIAALHRRTVRLYSDLLLHDMGPEAADICGVGAGPSEVRTEPLMGLRYRTSFLHHGRAKTLTDAILLHGGEAQSARHEFATLRPAARLVLLTFLKSL